MTTADTPERMEGYAFAWLCRLERMGWEGRTYRQNGDQVLIRVFPGALRGDSGRARVSVSVEHPGVRGRVSGSGNSLWEACQRLHVSLSTAGVLLASPSELVREMKNGD